MRRRRYQIMFQIEGRDWGCVHVLMKENVMWSGLTSCSLSSLFVVSQVRCLPNPHYTRLLASTVMCTWDKPWWSVLLQTCLCSVRKFTVRSDQTTAVMKSELREAMKKWRQISARISLQDELLGILLEHSGLLSRVYPCICGVHRGSIRHRDLSENTNPHPQQVKAP